MFSFRTHDKSHLKELLAKKKETPKQNAAAACYSLGESKEDLFSHGDRESERKNEQF